MLNNIFIRVKDFNDVVKDPETMSKLRHLTLDPYSGMNNELNVLSREANWRKVDCKIIQAFFDKKLVAWALLSKEPSNYIFYTSQSSYNPNYGYLFEIFVDPSYRRQGIGSKLLQTARRISNNNLCICPWDNRSNAFYGNFKNLGAKIL